jgi:hypothetical protein
MKIRLLLTLVGLAISFAMPTIAQQTSAPDPHDNDICAIGNSSAGTWRAYTVTAYVRALDGTWRIYMTYVNPL